MPAPDRKSHWEQVYATKAENQVSWFQESAATSLALLDHPSIGADSAIIDVGGGASRLVDALLARGYRDVTVLDLSAAALAAARARLGDRAGKVNWIEADIARWQPGRAYDAWHDRAVLHFLVDEADRAGYLAALGKALRPGGIAIIATFAPDGPEKCSGLPVRRYSAEDLAAFLGRGFRLIDSRRETHMTPWGTPQNFQYARFAREA